MSLEEQKSRIAAAARSAKSDLDNRVDAATANVKQEAADLQDSVMRGASDLAENVSTKLKSVGVDTDVMVNAAKGRATELQKLLMSELQDRPMRALGIAAAVGVLFGMLSSR